MMATWTLISTERGLIPAIAQDAARLGANIEEFTQRFTELAQGAYTPGDPLDPATTLGAGGPDDFGYLWIDSDEAGGPAFNWVDISAVGTPLGLSDDDGEEVPLPFPFDFYGETKSSITVGSNGYLTFGTDGTDLSNDPVPSTTDPNDSFRLRGISGGAKPGMPGGANPPSPPSPSPGMISRSRRSRTCSSSSTGASER